MKSSDESTEESRLSRLAIGVGVPSAAALAGSLGALGYLRRRFQARRTFLPDRYPNGIWNPAPYGLLAEDVWFESGDGVELHGWWIAHPRPRATILYYHGNSGSIAHQIGIFRHLRRLRVNIFAFDYRGYGRSSGQPSERGLYRDARAAWRLLTGELGQSSDSIVLFGHSLGGAVAIDAAQDCSAAGLIVQSTFTQMRDEVRAIMPTLPLHLAARNQFRSIDKIGSISMPKLFIHGTADGTVPSHLGEQLFEAAKPPKELYLVAGAGHNDVHRHGGARYLHRLARFLRANVRTSTVLGED